MTMNTLASLDACNPSNSLEKEVSWNWVSKDSYNKTSEFYKQINILFNCSLRDFKCFVLIKGISRRLTNGCVDTISLISLRIIIKHFRVKKRLQTMNYYYCRIVNEQRMLIPNKGENYG